MSRTIRCWFKKSFYRFKLRPWTWTAMNVFGRQKKKLLRKRDRRAIRSNNRTLFSRGFYEPEIERRGEYFD